MKQKKQAYLIGYRLRGKTYGMFTSYGFPVFSSLQVNVYTDKAILMRDYKKACQYVGKGGAPSFDKNIRVDKKFRGGQVFITRSGCNKVEFALPKTISLTDSTKTVALRVPFTYRSV